MTVSVGHAVIGGTGSIGQSGSPRAVVHRNLAGRGGLESIGHRVSWY